MKAQAVSFKEKVLNVVRDIPKGSVLSYKEVAQMAGNVKASRVVGSIMARNKDIEVPCHRVIKSDGTIGGYNGIRGEKGTVLKKEGYKA